MYDYFNKGWFKSSLLMTFATLWLACLRIFGIDFGLITSEGHLTELAHFITWPVIVISIAFTLIKNAAEKYDEVSKKNGQFILTKIIDSIDDIVNKKNVRFCNFLKDNVGKKDISPFAVITQPRDQIEWILSNIQITLSEIFGIDRQHLSISLIYWTDEIKHWSWLARTNIHNDLEVKDLINNHNTTAYKVINSHKNSIVHIDKLEASKKNEYLLSDRDRDFNEVGSIICREINVGESENPNIRAIISISTYGKLICNPGINVDETITKILHIIIPRFESRIKLELALLYIKDVLAVK